MKWKWLHDIKPKEIETSTYRLTVFWKDGTKQEFFNEYAGHFQIIVEQYKKGNKGIHFYKSSENMYAFELPFIKALQFEKVKVITVK